MKTTVNFSIEVGVIEKFHKAVPVGQRSAVVEELIRNKTEEIERGA